MTLSFGYKKYDVQWRATAPLPEPEKAATILYGGISGAIRGVGGVDTDVNNDRAAPKQMVGML